MFILLQEKVCALCRSFEEATAITGRKGCSEELGYIAGYGGFQKIRVLGFRDRIWLWVYFRVKGLGVS